MLLKKVERENQNIQNKYRYKQERIINEDDKDW